MTHDSHPPAVTIVIPTRDRPRELARCLSAILETPADTSHEIVVVDDGSYPALTLECIGCVSSARIRLLRCEGVGPAKARNAGIEAARGTVLLFTDDDTIPRVGWVDSAYAFLVDHPGYVGVTGPTTSPPYDRLYFHSVDAVAPGHFLTCNIAYRRSALIAIGGFADVFPYPHAEDLDLGVRISRLGTVGFSEAMIVVHPPRPVCLLQQVRRGRVLASDSVLFARHPDIYPLARYLSASGYALGLNLKRWLHCAFRDVYQVGTNPWRALRFLVLAVGYTSHGCAAMMGRVLR